MNHTHLQTAWVKSINRKIISKAYAIKSKVKKKIWWVTQANVAFKMTIFYVKVNHLNFIIISQ